MYVVQSYIRPITSEPDKLRQDIDGFYWTCHYATRYEITRDDSATHNFHCIDPVLLREMQNIKPQLDFTNRHCFFNDKLHLLNDTLIPIIIFLKSALFKRNLEFTVF